MAEIVPVGRGHPSLAGFFDQLREVMERSNRGSCAMIEQRNALADGSKNDGALDAFWRNATPVPGASEFFIGGTEGTADAGIT